MKDRGNEVLRKMRRGLGIRQVWLSKQTGIYRTKLSQWERGQIELTAGELLKVGEAIGAVVKERSEAGTLPRPKVALPQTSIEQGKAVAETRRSWGVTQSELARAIKKPEDTISLFENGYIELDAEELDNLNNALSALVNKKRAKAGLSKLERLQSSLVDKEPDSFGKVTSLASLKSFAPKRTEAEKEAAGLRDEYVKHLKKLNETLTKMISAYQEHEKEQDAEIANLNKLFMGLAKKVSEQVN